MKKIIIITLLATSIFSCKGKENNSKSAELKVQQISTGKTVIKEPKFEDVNGCAQYSNLYKALPPLDSYKNIGFNVIECQSTQEKSPFTVAMNVKYADKKSKNNFEATIFEISNQSAKEEMNEVNSAKATFKIAEQLALNPGPKLFVKSNLTILEYGTITIDDAPNANEMNHYVYTGVYKNKYVIKLYATTVGKTDVFKFEAFVKDYLQAIKLDNLN